MSPRKCRYHWVICLRAEHGLKQIKKSNFVHRKSKRLFFKNSIMLFVVPLTFCIDVVFKFSWGDCKSH